MVLGFRVPVLESRIRLRVFGFRFRVEGLELRSSGLG